MGGELIVKILQNSQYIRQNLDGFRGFLYDATGAITYMTPAILMNAILPGSGFAVTGITAAGGAYPALRRIGYPGKQAAQYIPVLSATGGDRHAFAGQ